MIYDALIIGAGPSGATAALLLKQAGWSVALVEKKIFPRRKVCGEFISATSLPLLQKLQLADFYLAHSGPEIKRVGLFARDTVATANMPIANHSVHRYGRALGREYLDTLLLQKAITAGVTCWQPATMIAMQHHDNSSTCTISLDEKQEEITARIIIIAHGSWERNVTGIHLAPHRASDLLAFKAHFKNSNLASDLMPLLAFPGGYGGLVTTDNQRITLSCCIRRDELVKVRETYPELTAGDAVLNHIMTNCLGVKNALQHAIRDGNWLAAGPIQPGIRKGYDNGVFYVGNMAGEAHPIVAEGISMAMQSAWILSEVLIQHRDEIMNHELNNAGQDYTKRWRQQFRTRIYAANIFAQFAMRPRLMAFFLPILSRFPSLISLGSLFSGKIKSVKTVKSFP